VQVEPPVLGDLLSRRLAREPTLVVTYVGSTLGETGWWDVVISTNPSDGTLRVDPRPLREASSCIEVRAARTRFDEVVADVLELCARQFSHGE
jgi:hypothetical protein